VSGPYPANMNSSHTLHVLTGPTAVGKTALALDWAEANGAVIVSCDSLLVYRGMDIGTAKPSPAELARVPHFCVDVADPAGAPYTVGEYIAEARRAVDAAVAAGRTVLVTGGSGFYLKSFYAPVMDAIEISDAVRAEVAALDAQGPEAALRRLRELEPAPPLWLDLENPRRVTKALERRLASGRSLAELKAEFDARPGAFDDFEKKTVVLTRAVESLEARIRRRVEIMLRDGIVDEVKRLLATGLNPDSPAAVATGYRETLAWLRDGEPGGQAALGESIAIATRQLAAKQRKWFRNQLPDTVRVIDLDAGTPGANTLFS
jgi:tRNA dimethylallyltransferase